MSVPLAAAPPVLSVPRRALLFGLAAAVGVLGGLGWSGDASTFVYESIVRTFVSPDAQITSLAMGVALAFVVGFAHLPTI